MTATIRSTQLAGLRVLDLGPGIAPALCARLLADRGADVVKVEPPEGDPVRRLAPTLDGKPAEELGLVHLYVDWNKRGVRLDLTTPDGRSRLDELVARADVVIEGHRPEESERLGIDYARLQTVNPGVIVVSITGHGSTGPKRNRRWTDLTNYAQSGVMSFSGTSDREPLRHGGMQSEFSGAFAALVPTMAAIYQQRAHGGGCHVDVSLTEALTSQLVLGIPYVTYMDRIPSRRAPVGDSFGNCFPAADGWVIAHSPRSGKWSDFCDFVGEPELDDPAFATSVGKLVNAERLDELLGRALARRDRFELFHSANQQRILFGVVQSPADLAACPQLAARGFYETVEHPIAGELTYPVTGFAMEDGQRVIARPAPLLGQHDDEVFAEWGRLEPGRGATAAPRRPLDGVRVIDASHVFAVPYAATMLAELGADVVKIQPPDRIDIMASWGPYPENEPGERYWDRVGSLNTVNKGKRGLPLDLKDPRGKELFLSLVERSDVLLEAFTPGVLERLGLSDEVLFERNPKLVILSNSGFGRTGPWSSYGSVATSLEGTAGTCWLSGYPDRGPSKIGQSYTDFVAAWSAAAAVIAALAASTNLPSEQRIDQSMYQVGASTIGPWIMDAIATGRVVERMGNADENLSPNGVFRAGGDDCWIAVAVDSRESWRALCDVLGLDDLAADPSFDTVEGRRRAEPAIHARIADAVRPMDPGDLETRLQDAGVAAAKMLDCADVLRDAHLIEREFFEPITHREESGVGTRPYIGRPWRLSNVSLAAPGPAPMFGEHTAELLTELGVSADEQRQLTADGVTPTTPLARTRPAAPLQLEEMLARHKIAPVTASEGVRC